MPRTDLFLKVVVQHGDDEKPERLADEICRRIAKIHGVRSAELSHYTSAPAEEESANN